MPRIRLGGPTHGARRPEPKRVYFEPRTTPKRIGSEGVHLRAASGKQCGLSIVDVVELILTCQRADKHPGCHLDVDRDVWFDEYKGKWIIMPRSSTPVAAKRGRKAPTRKGV